MPIPLHCTLPPKTEKQKQRTLTTHAEAPVECALTLHHHLALVTVLNTYHSMPSPRHNMLSSDLSNVACISMVILVLARPVSAVIFRRWCVWDLKDEHKVQSANGLWQSTPQQPIVTQSRSRTPERLASFKDVEHNVKAA